MGTMQKPWPSAQEAIKLDTDDLALRIVDRLDTTPTLGILASRKGFIHREVSEAEAARLRRPGRPAVVRSEDAVADNPDLARAYGEAWDYAVRQGWIGEDPAARGRVYVTSAGDKRLAEYRRAAPPSSEPPAGEAILGGGKSGAGQPVLDVISSAQSPPGADAKPSIRVFVSWAHAHRSTDSAAVEEWTELVAQFTTKLRELGIDADIDLFHLHEDDVDWTTFGVEGIKDADYVLIIGSQAYKERWEGTASPRSGAGAAREANALKAQFEDDRNDFLKRVKLVILPGVRREDLPLELRSVNQRYRIESIDAAGLDGLLRTLTGAPEWVKPPVGELPPLPPRLVRGIELANRDAGDQAGGAAADQLIRRRDSVEKLIADQPDGERADGLRMEQASIDGALRALDDKHAAGPPGTDTGLDADDESRQYVDETKAAIEKARDLMQHLPAVVREAIFQDAFDRNPLVVSGWGDKLFTLDEARAAEEDGYLEVEDYEGPTFVARTGKRPVAKAMHAVKEARGLACDDAQYGTTMSDWMIDALTDDYDLDDEAFVTRSNWKAFGFL